MKRCIAAIVMTYALATSAAATEAMRTPPLQEAIHSPNAGRHGMVSAEEERAARIGAEILEQGGNAVDAAVATGFALAVTHPSAGNLGGGGFMLIRMTNGDTLALDFRETAPAMATRDMFIGADGKVDEVAALYSHKSSGVPGTVAGLLHAQAKFGRLPLKKVIQPAIDLAAKGYRLHYFEIAELEASRDTLMRNEAARAEFFKSNGDGYFPGELYRRPALARVLKEIARKGRDGFYKGWVAAAIADDMAANGGLITREDLAGYAPVERAALSGTYRNLEVIAFPPPSSGGPLLLQMLNMLETRPPMSRGDRAEELHILVEIMRRAYADRSVWIGDPDFANVPTVGLVDKVYARARAATIDPARASASSEVGEGAPPRDESPDTTHYSVIDADGNMVATTYTLNLSYGSGVVIPGTGILMNNEMDDFAAQVGAPNAYGLVMGEANAIEPGKRPLSSMTPTLILKDDAPYMAIGAPGGSRIITAVLNAVVNVVDRGMNIAEATTQPRIHHQWLPDEVLYERGISEDTIDLLRARGHEIREFDWHARVQTVVMEDGWFYGYADPRSPGGAACAAHAGC